MGCAVDSCYSLTPATTTLTYTTTEDGAAMTITTTSVTTSTPTTISSVTSDGAVAKFFPSTVSKTEATASAGSSSGDSSGNGGLSKGAIGGIIAAAAIILIAVLVAAFFIIKRLKQTEQVVQVYRETTSGTRTRQTNEKKSEVNVRVVPTPSEVDAMDYDPLMMNSSVASPRRPGHRPPMAQNRARGGSDAASQPSLWSGQSATRWNTPSVNSDTDDNGPTTFFELPPRVHQQHPDGRPAMRQSVNSNESAYSYHNFAHAHGRNASNASELSTGSDDNGSQHGIGSPLMPIELGVDGEFRPELPASDTETESSSGHRQPRRKGTATSINDMVSPMSMRPGVAPASRGRRRGDSQTVSPMEGRPGAVDGRRRSGLGSIDESASMTASNSLHGHYGPTVGKREADMGNSPTVPGFVPLERPSQDGSETQ